MGVVSRAASNAVRASGIRACCGETGCYKRAHLRGLTEVPEPMVRVLIAELSACEAGLERSELIKVARLTARRDSTLHLALKTLREMENRRMHPSLLAHNALFKAYGRLGMWAESESLLLRMRQLGLEPDERTYLEAIRAGAGVPGGSLLAKRLLPNLLPNLSAARSESEQADRDAGRDTARDGIGRDRVG